MVNDARGKILRINPLVALGAPFTVPASNPFVGSATMIPEAYSIGHRNPHHLAFATDGTLIVAEAGRDNIDEVNIVTAGANYGWPKREGTLVHLAVGTLWGGVDALPANDATLGYTYPVMQFLHQGQRGSTFTGQSIGGGYVVENGSALNGLYFATDFVFSGDVFVTPLASLKAAVTSWPTASLRVAPISKASVLFDHDSNAATPAIAVPNLAEVTVFAPGYDGSGRVDMRYGQGPAGELYLLSKRDRRVYLVTNSTPRGPEIMNGQRTPFPRGFLWGAATAAFQIEGSTDADGRGESIWDRFCDTPGKVANGDHGRVACDHYRRWPQDLDLARALNFNAYRFSVAWPRIQPTADGKVNPKGLEFYDKLVDGMLERGLAPFMTLYHWDLPQYLQDQGGWANRETADRFVDYARIVAGRLGDRVKGIATFNEPFVTAFLGHWTGMHAPGIEDPQVSVNASLHQLLAHGRAVQALRADGVKAPLGIVNVMGPVHTATSSDADRREADRFDLLFNRLYLEPLLNGRLPERTQELLGVTPAVRDGDLATISTPIDFLGMNYYFRRIADATSPQDPRLPPGAIVTEMGWEVYHEGLTEHLVDMKRRYANLPPIYITESGCACDDHVVDGRIDDHFRVAYLQGQIAAIGRAIAAGVDMRGYFAWSLMDNFEWAHGYSKRFGMVHVDYATQQRTVKASGNWYRDFIASGG